MKSQLDAPLSTRTIRRHLNIENIKHKKRIHRPRLTMKHKEKRLAYTRQYQTMSAKECLKVVFSDKKKFNLDVSVGFQKYWRAKNFPVENYSTRYSGRGSLMIWGGLLIFGKTCQGSSKSSRLCEDAKWFISRTSRASSMWRRMDFSAR